jgi:CO/xanthine dehydrogenase Mo-binding subunit
LPTEFAPGLSTEVAVITKAYGDLEAAFAEAHAVVSLELTIGRHSGVPLETRGAIAVPEAESGILRLYGAAKVPHYNRQALAAMLGLPLDRIHLHEGHVGGGFGIRGELYPEDILTCAAALRLGRPIKWIEDRYEHLVAANQSRGSVHRVRSTRRALFWVLTTSSGLTREATSGRMASSLPTSPARCCPAPT